MTPKSQDAMVLPPSALDRLLPMHLLLTATGHVRHVGPTLEKLALKPLIGQRFLETFELRRPRNVDSMQALAAVPGGRLNLAFRTGARTALIGQVQPLPDGEVLINLAFGISLVEAIRRNRLTAADFAPTDPTVEMLYLAEARSAVIREATKLNDRLRDARQDALNMAMSDALTGLGNRRALDEAMARLLNRQRPFGLMHLDLDFFKDVNDSLGHAAGDAVLAEVARTLLAATRAEDVVARVGGDEFLVLFPGLVDPDRLVEIGRRIIDGLEQPFRWQKRTCRISGSIGICTSEMYDTPEAERMQSDADTALYASKHAGRATVTVFGQDSLVGSVRSAG